MKKPDQTNTAGGDQWPPPVRLPIKTFAFDKSVEATEYPDALEVRATPRPSWFVTVAIWIAAYYASSFAIAMIAMRSGISHVIIPPGGGAAANGRTFYVTVQEPIWFGALETAGPVALATLLTYWLRRIRVMSHGLTRFRFEREGRILRSGGDMRPLGPYIHAETKDRQFHVVLDDPAGKAEKRIRGFTSMEKAEHAARYIQAFLAGVRLYGEADSNG